MKRYLSNFNKTDSTIKINKAVQDVRNENKLENYEKDKIIDLDRTLLFKHLDALSNI
jgi:hypothetical protein